MDLMTRIKMHIFKVKLPFYPPCEVKCGLQNRVSTIGTLLDEFMGMEYSLNCSWDVVEF